MTTSENSGVATNGLQLIPACNQSGDADALAPGKGVIHGAGLAPALWDTRESLHTVSPARRPAGGRGGDRIRPRSLRFAPRVRKVCECVDSRGRRRFASCAEVVRVETEGVL